MNTESLPNHWIINMEKKIQISTTNHPTLPKNSMPPTLRPLRPLRHPRHPRDPRSLRPVAWAAPAQVLRVATPPCPVQCVGDIARICFWGGRLADLVKLIEFGKNKIKFGKTYFVKLLVKLIEFGKKYINEEKW